MLIGILLTFACGWLVLRATPRADGPHQRWPYAALGVAAALVAVGGIHAGGMGLAVSIAFVLGVAMLAIPCLSYCQARRRGASKRAVR